MKKNDFFSNALRLIPPIVTIILVLLVLWFGSQLSLEQLISYTPSHLFLAAAAVIFLFAVKSLSVVFPLSALYILSSFWFGPWIAILVNYLGLTVCMTIPYCIGRMFGGHLIDKLVEKYPKLLRLQQLGISNQVMLAYLLRIVSVLPGDLCSLFLGTCSVEYKRYLLGSLLGLSPVMILHVLFADLFKDSLSAGFLSSLTPESLVVIIVLIIISVISSILLNKKYSIKEK